MYSFTDSKNIRKRKKRKREWKERRKEFIFCFVVFCSLELFFGMRCEEVIVLGILPLIQMKKVPAKKNKEQ